MRTTLNLDRDMLDAARSLAEQQSKSMGEVVSQLMRRALAPPLPEIDDDGFPVFEVSPDAPPITPEAVARALEEEA